MDDWLVKLIAAAVVIAAVVLDWPRALAGFALGIWARQQPRPGVLIAAGVIAIAALGEVLYSLIGRTGGMSGASFIMGLVAAGITAVGLVRVLRGIGEHVGS